MQRPDFDDIFMELAVNLAKRSHCIKAHVGAVLAKENAILYAAKNGSMVEGSTLYVTLSPCLPCARIIFSMKIKKVVYLNSYAEYKGIDLDEGLAFLDKFGVEVQQYNGKFV